MVGNTEVLAGLTRMALFATRRIGEDQLRGLAEAWVEGLREVEPVGFRRAAKAFGDEGKWPALGEFRTRARAMTPGMWAAEEAVPEHATCPVGHRYVWRKWSNRSGRVQGIRPWCLCADRAAELYGETWGEEVAASAGGGQRWQDVLRYGAPRGGEPVPIGAVVHGDAYEGY